MARNLPTELEQLLLKVACATSSHEACAELTNLSSIIAQNQLLVPVHQLHHVRCCLNAEEIPRNAGVWCPKVAQLLDGIDLQCQTLARVALSRETAQCTEAKRCMFAEDRRAPRAPRRLATPRKQVCILRTEGNISRAGAKEMKQVEAGYDVQEEQRRAQNIHDNNRGCSSENVSELEAVEGQGVRQKTSKRKSPMQSVLNTFSPVKRCKQDTDVYREEVTFLGHDEHVPPYPVASDHYIQSVWSGRRHDPRNEAGIDRHAVSRLQSSSCRLQAQLGSMQGKEEKRHAVIQQLPSHEHVVLPRL